MSKGDYHVVPRDRGWALMREGAQKATSLHDTQKDALQAGRNLAKKHKTELVTHGRDNLIRDSDSYGNDPFPPRDREY